MKKDILLSVKNLTVTHDGRELLHGIDMDVARGARHLVMGHNGGGKSTLATVIAGTPEFETTHGKIVFDGADITHESPTNRALRGIFIGAQNVPEIPGLTVLSFLKHSCVAHTHFETGRDLSMADFLGRVEDARQKLNIPREWLNRGINAGFSGGERKRLMLLHMVMVAPVLAILDEPDSGADAATQRLIATTVADMTSTTFIIISHQQKFIDMIAPTATTEIANGHIKQGE